MIQTIIPVKPEPIPHITPSNATTIMQCAYQIIVRRSTKKHFLPPSATMEFGTAIHKAFELSVKQSFTNRHDVERFVDNIVHQAEESCQKRGYDFLTPFDNQVRNFGVKRELAIRKIESTTSLTNGYSSTTPTLKSHNYIEVEREFTSKRFKIQGKIDAILHRPDGDVLVDFKSGSIYDKHDNGERSLKISYENQLKLYAYLYYEATGKLPIGICVETLTGSVVNLSFTLEQCVEYAQNLDEQLSKVNQLIHTNQIDALKPINIDVCQWCSVRPACNFYQPVNKRTGFVDLFGRLTAINKLLNGNYSISLTNFNGTTRIVGILAIDAEKLQIDYEYRLFNLRSIKVSLLSFTTSSSIFEVTPY
ncbi:PD-(D/E)XK nuclease family protein [Siphonobacter curvatus]|uniref:PD-(D/E)XK endonuclease-like domain-containing protein n=1 Tax=Siphonobacter curvatus TaxID=2094562 RepID=A0A2S7III4_9BACT|nr:PD-(D/E)XK nuclease family protein [Siphonobacter curvatus]PQA55667.1 hypothetical protein C5O19_19850 [Siphonobacter curvatus]